MGAFERSQIADVFSELDVVVVPSLWYENAPLVIAEAFAAGKPVIATNLSGMSELVRHEVNGLLFERGDVRSLATALRRIIVDPTLRGRLRAGIQPARTIEQEVDELVQLYQDHRAAVQRIGSRSDDALQLA
jgi:glycosyltransferase involved in cell wall biosynthesis